MPGVIPGLQGTHPPARHIERTVRLIAGLVLLMFTALAALVDPRWVLGVIATGIASVFVALTGFCLVGNVLLGGSASRPCWATRLGPGDLLIMQTDRWFLERRIYLAVGIRSRSPPC